MHTKVQGDKSSDYSMSAIVFIGNIRGKHIAKVDYIEMNLFHYCCRGRLRID